MTKLIILDRDGVINQDSPNYIKSVAEWIPIAGSIEAIAQLSQSGWKIVIATNQSGLARGLFCLKDLDAMHQKLQHLVANHGGHIAGIFYCPHLPDDGCNCRKPKVGLLNAIEQQLGLSVQGQYFVGDSIKDLQAAQLKSCQGILVKTGKGQDTFEKLASMPELNAPWVFESLAEVATHLLQMES